MNSDERTTPSVIDYATTAPSNRYATPAVIVGVAGFLLPFIPAIIAIVLGRRGVRLARETPLRAGEGASKTGIVLGVVALVFWCGLAIAAVPAMQRAKAQAQRVQCLTHLRQLSMAVMMYSAENQGVVPQTFDQLVASGLLPGAAQPCPAAPPGSGKPVAMTGATRSYSYYYLGAGRQINQVKRAATEPLFYEPLTNHDGTSINVAFFDGHCETLTGPAATAFLAKYPPPTTAPSPTTAATMPAVEIEPAP